MQSSVRIGTPLSSTATKVMMLGSGELGKEVIIALQRLGVEFIAVDRYANAPGHQLAHRSHVIDMTDGDALAALIALEKPDLVVPEIEAIATAKLVELEAAGAIRVIPTARAAWLTMNREGIRRLAAEELGLPTSPYQFADSLDELKVACEAVGFPCIVKPVMSSSGKGQSRLDSAVAVEAAWDHAAKGSRVDSGRVIAEGFIDFDYEITLLTVRAMGQDGQVETLFCEPIGHVQVSGDYVESWQPHPMAALALSRARDVAKSITDSEFELHAKAILGLPVTVALTSPAASAVIYGGLDAHGIAFEGIEQALRVPGADLRLFGKPESFKKRRMGVALAVADDIATARERAKLAASLVKPVDGR